MSSLCYTSNFHWLSILHMVMYMIPCYSLNSSHPLIPSLCPQVCSLCLHLHCCPADRLISTIFLYSTYIKLTEKDTCMPMFTAALFTTVRTWKQPRRPSTDEWIKTLWYIYTMEYYSAIKRNPYFLMFLCIHHNRSVERQDVRNAGKRHLHSKSQQLGVKSSF